jgi:uncharacterized membrane protein
MNRAWQLGLCFAAAVAVGHVATVIAAPRAIMHLAMGRLSQHGRLINAFRFSDRIDAHARWVVRPSPDLAYASCVYDLSRGAIMVSAAPSADHGYTSVSVFAAQTDNIAAFDTLTHPQGIRFALALRGQTVPQGVAVVRTASAKGIILDRRLAPDAAAFAAADHARRADRCAPIDGAWITSPRD